MNALLFIWLWLIVGLKAGAITLFHRELKLSRHFMSIFVVSLGLIVGCAFVFFGE